MQQNGSLDVDLPIGFSCQILFFKNSFEINAVNPNDAKIITAIDANTSNLTKVELTYTPTIPIINANPITYHF